MEVNAVTRRKDIYLTYTDIFHDKYVNNNKYIELSIYSYTIRIASPPSLVFRQWKYFIN